MIAGKVSESMGPYSQCSTATTGLENNSDILRSMAILVWSGFVCMKPGVARALGAPHCSPQPMTPAAGMAVGSCVPAAPIWDTGNTSAAFCFRIFLEAPGRLQPRRIPQPAAAPKGQVLLRGMCGLHSHPGRNSPCCPQPLTL